MKLSNKADFPYFLRTLPRDADVAKGFVLVCQHFRWPRVGLLYEDTDDMQGFYGAVLGWKDVLQDINLEIDAFPLPHYPDAASINRSTYWVRLQDVAESGLRVIGLKYESSEKAIVILDVALTLELHTALFITIHVDAYDALTSHQQALWNGMMGIDFSRSGETEIARRLEELWHTMDFPQLLHLGLPQEMVSTMESTAPDLFKRSPYIKRNAYLVDAIMAVVLAFHKSLDQYALKKEPLESTNRSGSIGDTFRDLSKALFGLYFEGASGWVRFTRAVNGSGGDRYAPRLALHQAQAGRMVESVGNILDWINLTAPVKFHTPQAVARDYDPLPILRLGFCGSAEDSSQLRWPAVVAVARKSVVGGGVTAMLPQLGDLGFRVSWQLAYTNTSLDEAAAGINLVMGGRSPPKAGQRPVDALIGCVSDTCSLHAAAIGNVMRTVQVSPFAQSERLSNKVEFPYFLRTAPTTANHAVGLLSICSFFRWRRIGLVYEETPYGSSFHDAAADAGLAENVQIEPFGMHCYGWTHPKQGFGARGCVDKAMLPRLFESRLRVFGVAVQHDVLPALAEAVLKMKLQHRLFIVHDAIHAPDAFGLRYRRAFEGMLTIDHLQAGRTMTAERMLHAWRQMDYGQLAHWGVPEGLIKRMFLMLPDQFVESPFKDNSAHMLDAILAVLLAAKWVLKNGEWGVGARSKSISADSLRNGLRIVSFPGASGHVAFTQFEGTEGGDRLESMHILRQVQNGDFVELGHVGAGRVHLEPGKYFRFPDGGSDPRMYDEAPPIALIRWEHVALAFAALACLFLVFLVCPVRSSLHFWLHQLRSPWLDEEAREPNLGFVTGSSRVEHAEWSDPETTPPL
eukprot:CAMPEP_0179012622 /NCGR_PEP_ID=MMETSP0796-20121207/1301_1 /TAXON_ID=73915 /ORGANISM="Pyrodinium bahamense, Strain pbaha01" /LENGTH=854 /DNA_ID=CAMNT_0020708091 /DNA_START=50 /DNA_END=2616 /DNA_ORIENTATION=-